LDCGEKIIKVAMASHVVFFMVGAIDVSIETAEEANDTKGSSKGSNRVFVRGVFCGGIERFSGILTQDTKLECQKTNMSMNIPLLDIRHLAQEGTS
jgi:hypothetical protein